MRSFAARDGSDLDWAGALMQAQHYDDVRAIRNFVDAYAKGLKRRGRRRGK